MSFDLLLAVLAINLRSCIFLTRAGEYSDLCSESSGSDISYYRGGAVFFVLRMFW